MHFFNDLTPERGWDWIRKLEVRSMSRLFLTLPLLLTLFVNPSLADDGDEERSQPAVNQIQINGSSILIYGNELIKNKRDKVFFAAESSSEMIEVPFTEDGDDFLEVILPYEPSAGTYRLGIGKSQKQLRVSELITFVTDTPESNRYTADCTEDSSAFTTLMASLNRSVVGTAVVRLVGDCKVGSRIIFRLPKTELIGYLDDLSCPSSNRLSSDAERFRFEVVQGASLSIRCLHVGVDGGRLRFGASGNSHVDISALRTDAKVELSANSNSYMRYRNFGIDGQTDGHAIDSIVVSGQSNMLASDVNFAEGAGIFVDNGATLELYAYPEVGSIDRMYLDFGASVNLGPVPTINRVDVQFGSRLRGDLDILDLRADESSIVCCVRPLEP